MSGKPAVTIGDTFGRWTVIERIGSSRNRTAIWLCRCECGGEGQVVSTSLLNGNSKSCGCLRKETVVKNLIDHKGRHICRKKLSDTKIKQMLRLRRMGRTLKELSEEF
jgi:hypothetical protein